jgi:hypothetical protein
MHASDPQGSMSQHPGPPHPASPYPAIPTYASDLMGAATFFLHLLVRIYRPLSHPPPTPALVPPAPLALSTRMVGSLSELPAPLRLFLSGSDFLHLSFSLPLCHTYISVLYFTVCSSLCSPIAPPVGPHVSSPAQCNTLHPTDIRTHCRRAAARASSRGGREPPTHVRTMHPSAAPSDSPGTPAPCGEPPRTLLRGHSLTIDRSISHLQ